MRNQRLGFVAKLPALLVASILGWIAVSTAWRIALRTTFPYDLLYWADDYFFTVVMKIDSGVPVYSEPADANSWIYGPGAPYLHWALLSPLRLVRNFVANKVLAQVWLGAAISLGSWASLQVVDACEVRPTTPGALLLLHATVTFALALAAFTNPVADSLHPVNLELCVLSLSIGTAARWHRLSPRARTTVAVLLPAVGMCFKQTAGLTAATTFSLLALTTHGSVRDRVLRSAIPLMSLGATLLAFVAGTSGMYWRWCYLIPRAAPWEMWKIGDFTEGMGLWLYPVLAVLLARSARAVVLRSSKDLAWARAILPVVLYTPLAVIALLKAMGGPNNITVVSFLFAVVALPPVVTRMLDDSAMRRNLASTLVATLTYTSWLPQKRVPTSADYAHGAATCEYFAALTRCGERVLMPRGAVCFAVAGVPYPIDRAMAAMDVATSRRRVGLTTKLANEEYDVAIVTETDLRSPWLEQALRVPLDAHYVPFGHIEGGQAGDLWLEGWGDLMEGRTTLFERRRERGAHRAPRVGEPTLCRRSDRSGG